MSDKEPLPVLSKYFFEHDNAHVHNEYVLHIIIVFSTPVVKDSLVKNLRSQNIMICIFLIFFIGKICGNYVHPVIFYPDFTVLWQQLRVIVY